ncbi:MAG: flagellar hook-associated protein FlgL [Halanaerobium sp.]|nr:flagellar hook-associated protein FlgL [Halanaerobium sp.]
MRITSGVMIDNMMRYLQKNMAKLDKLNQQLASGKQFQVPSENPTGAATTMSIKDAITGSEQYIRNIERSSEWLSNNESALDNAGKILQRARELAVYASNETLASEDKDAIALEIDQLREELMNIANTKVGDRYLFSGMKTDTRPFSESGSLAAGVDFNGDSNSLEREIGPGIKIGVSVDGYSIFKDGIDTLQALSEQIKNDTPATVGGVTINDTQDAIGFLDTIININLKQRASIGAKVNRLELAKSRLEDQKFQSEKLLAKNEDIDITKVITDLKMQETVYRASLAVGARIMQPTLVDFLA